MIDMRNYSNILDRCKEASSDINIEIVVPNETWS